MLKGEWSILVLGFSCYQHRFQLQFGPIDTSGNCCSFWGRFELNSSV